MAWDDELPTLVRTLVQDLGATPVYTDDRLSQMVLLTALNIQQEVAFKAYYKPDIVNLSLRPDPTAALARDDGFINLVCLKAALLLIMAEIRDLSRQGITIKDGKSLLSLKRDAKGLKLMIDSYQKQYDEALYAYKVGGVDSLGQIVVTPFPPCFGDLGGDRWRFRSF